MFGSIDGSGGEDRCSQPQSSYTTGTYTSNASQNNFIATLITDFVAETDYNYNYNSFGFESTHTNHQFDSSEASSPPPTPDIISSFAGFTPESPLSTPTYQTLCSSPNYGLQSPTSSCSSMSIASPPITYVETRKRLIKDSLRLTIQSRRVAQGLDQIEANDMSSNTNTESDTTSPDITLTYADSERRRRRRERNKVAATKCRNKKKLHSIKLHQESESLQVNNAQMRKEIEDLRTECQQLMNILSTHESICKHSMNFANNYTNFHTNYDENNNNNYSVNNNNHNNNNISFANNNNNNSNNSYTNNSYYSNNLNLHSI